MIEAQNRGSPRRVVAKVEWHQRELFPRVGFIVTDLHYPPKGIVRFCNGRGIAEQWIMVIIDVGAHVGYYSLLAARQVGPTGRVYAFEPDSSNHDLLLGNIERNGYTNIVAMRKAVSNRVVPMTLFLTGLDDSRHSAYRHGLPERRSVW